MKIIEMVEGSGKKNYEIANEFGIPSSTLSTILKNKANILMNFKMLEPDRKKMRHAEYPKLESGLLKWFIQCQNDCKPITGPLLKEKADVLAKSLGYDCFKNSSGWLDKWKKRNNVVLRKSSSVDTAKPNKNRSGSRDYIWANYIMSVVNKYSPNDIYNANETGLRYKCLPERIRLLSGIDTGLTSDDEGRFTILLCTNMNGTDKIRPLIIGNSEKPRYFDNIESLPVDYEWNINSWMSDVLWNKWLLKLDEKIRMENRKIILFVDNCAVYHGTAVSNLKSVAVRHFPSSIGMDYRPLVGRGVIRTFKSFYREELIKKFVKLKDHERHSFDIDYQLAAQLIGKAWMRITPETVAECFKNAGFIAFSTVMPGPSSLSPMSMSWTPHHHKFSHHSHWDQKDPVWCAVTKLFNKNPDGTYDGNENFDDPLPVRRSSTVSIAPVPVPVPPAVSTTSAGTLDEATRAFAVLRDFLKASEGRRY